MDQRISMLINENDEKAFKWLAEIDAELQENLETTRNLAAANAELMVEVVEAKETIKIQKSLIENNKWEHERAALLAELNVLKEEVRTLSNLFQNKDSEWFSKIAKQISKLDALANQRAASS